MGYKNFYEKFVKRYGPTSYILNVCSLTEIDLIHFLREVLTYCQCGKWLVFLKDILIFVLFHYFTRR